MAKRLITILALSGLLWGIGAPVASADVAAANKLPSVTTSYYMHTADASTLALLGCRAGARTIGLPDAQDDLIILMFGAPKAQDGLEGATIYRGAGAPSSGFASTAEIARGAEAFIGAYLNCADSVARLDLVLGTSNWGTHITTQHGAAWGQMVKDIAAWNASLYFNNRVAVFGGSDIEVGWGKPAPARAWVDAYVSTGAPRLYDFGDAEGCPTSDKATPVCHNGWTSDDVWYIAWGSGGSIALPQIYNAVYAKQWYQLRRYSLSKAKDGYSPLAIAGVLTMDGDCRQSGGCGSDFNFTPEQGYRQLADLLGSGVDTSQSLPFLSDIKKAWLP